MNNKRLLVLPRYTSKGPSSHVRFYQYLPYLEEAGLSFDVHPFFGDAYIDALFNRHPQNILGIISSYFQRIFTILKSGRYDLVWMQYELLPFIPYCLENIFLKGITKLVVDYDDAVFHRYDTHPQPLIRSLLGNKIDRIMKSAALVIAGNPYLADRALQAGSRRVEILPSVVDLQKYPLDSSRQINGEPLRIGWLGSPATSQHLLVIENVIKKILLDGFRFIIIGADPPKAFSGYPVESLKWSPEKEAELIKTLNVGVMPLIDASFERGKCGYKLIQYMACGLPVIASPVGVNKEIVDNGKNGFLASNENEWLEALSKLKADAVLRQHMGRNGRKLVEEKYSLQVCSPKLISLLKGL